MSMAQILMTYAPSEVSTIYIQLMTDFLHVLPASSINGTILGIIT